MEGTKSILGGGLIFLNWDNDTKFKIWDKKLLNLFVRIGMQEGEGRGSPGKMIWKIRL